MGRHIKSNMEIKNKDYKGQERRNGGKLRLSTGEWIRIVILFVALVTGYVRLEMTVKGLAKDSEKKEKKIEKADKKNNEQDIAIAKIQTQLESINERTKDTQALVVKIAIKMGVD